LQFNTGLAAGKSGLILASLCTLNQNAVFAGGAGYTLYLFTSSPTAQATNAPYDLATADLACGPIGKIVIDTLTLKVTNCSIANYGHNVPFTLAAADTKLYGKLVCNGSETTISGKVINTILTIIAA
jgi:hypothetical protein